MPSEGKVLEFKPRASREILGNLPIGVPGLVDIARGFKPPYPMTVYVISGDSDSGIAGMVFPNGEFLPTKAPTRKTVYWGDDFIRREADVKWQGSVAGSINPLGEDGNHKGPIHKREWDSTLHDGPWVTTGELWRAMERGTAMRRGPQPGRIHVMDDERRAA